MGTFNKKFLNPLIDWLEATFIWIWYTFIPLLPLKASYAIARFISSVVLRLFTKQRNAILHNMQSAFENQMPEDEKMTIAQKMITNLFKGFFEGFYIASPFSYKLEGRIMLEGREHLERALAYGKGVIAVSAHLGNFTLLGAAMTREHYSCHVVVRHPKSKPIAALFQMFRDRSGQKTIPTQPWRECTKRMLKCLRNNEIVCLIADEDKRRGGVHVAFFGTSSPTAAGPAVLSLRTGAPIVPIFIIRQEDDTHKIIIEPPLECHLTGKQQEDIYRITSTFTERIEQYIRNYPDQWLWFNRRWRNPKNSPRLNHQPRPERRKSHAVG